MPKKNPPEKIIPTARDKRKGNYWKKLNQIFDPELNLGIVDIGLIYNINKDKEKINIVMTLTSPICPYGKEIMDQIRKLLKKDKNIKKINIEIVWDPPWSFEMMDPVLKAILFSE